MTKIKVIKSDKRDSFEAKVDEFCKDKIVSNIQCEFNPAISTRFLAFITYQNKFKEV